MPSSTAAPRICLVHAVYPAMAPIHAALDELWPDAQRSNIVDDGLPRLLQEQGGITAVIRDRFAALARLAASQADGVLFTCSAFAEAIDHAAGLLPIPVLKPEAPMLEQAAARGGRVGMIATYGPSIPSMEAVFRQIVLRSGAEASLESVLVPQALDATLSGDVARHDQLVADAVPRLAHCDTIVLAHFSTSTALRAAQARTDRLVLSAPHAAVAKLRQEVSGRRSG
jgi:threonine dehydrogenase-like Zn-dependent dehydrogenase